MYIQCPCCGGNSARSVPAILRNDVRTHETHRSGFKVGRHGYGLGGDVMLGSVRHVSSSPLVEALTPPSKPKLPPAPAQPRPRQIAPPPPKAPPGRGNQPFYMAILSGGLGCLSLPFAMFFSWQVFDITYLHAVVVLAAIAFFIYRGIVASTSEETKRDAQAHSQAMQRWQGDQAFYHAQAQAQWNAAMVQWQHDTQVWQAHCGQIEAQWTQAMTIWNALFYCDRCDHVFLPQTGEYAPLSLVTQLLWRQR